MKNASETAKERRTERSPRAGKLDGPENAGTMPPAAGSRGRLPEPLLPPLHSALRRGESHLISSPTSWRLIRMEAADQSAWTLPDWLVPPTGLHKTREISRFGNIGHISSFEDV